MSCAWSSEGEGFQVPFGVWSHSFGVFNVLFGIRLRLSLHLQDKKRLRGAQLTPRSRAAQCFPPPVSAETQGCRRAGGCQQGYVWLAGRRYMKRGWIRDVAITSSS